MNPPTQMMESEISANLKLAPRCSPQDRGIRKALVRSEFEQVSAAQAGSTGAFDELQRRYSRSLFKAILRITKNWEDAEDALQDTFLRAYMAIGSFEGRSSVYSWIMRIAINSALMVLRRRRARPRVFMDESGEEYSHEIADTALNPEQLCELRQRNHVLLCAIANLEPKLRVPLEIQLSDERPMKEIAESLKLSVPAVKARLYRARVHLAKRVSDSKKHRLTGPSSRRLPVRSQEQPSMML